MRNSEKVLQHQTLAGKFGKTVTLWYSVVRADLFSDESIWKPSEAMPARSNFCTQQWLHYSKQYPAPPADFEVSLHVVEQGVRVVPNWCAVGLDGGTIKFR